MATLKVGHSKRTWWRGFTLLLLCAWLLAGCSSGSPTVTLKPGDKALGERCSKTEDCASLVCVRLDAKSGICSQFCRNDADCPASDNWACLGPIGEKLAVCACRPLADHEICGDGVDNDCDGKVDDCRICHGKAVENDDHENCGACDHACRADQSCESGRCRCTPERPDACQDACVDLTIDAEHCGSCETACNTGEVCEDGKCGCPNAGDTYCPGVGCVDASKSHEHCGDCATACAAAESCRAGKCQCPNDAESYCGKDGCVNLATTHDHCGSCDNACDQGRSCQDSKCACPSAAAPDFCDGVGCIDESTSHDHCGACARACRADQVCTSAQCACPAGKTECNGTCVDTATDTKNCGGCGDVCPPAQACIAGSCGCAASGYAVCGDLCAHLSDDPKNCGKCGNGCAPGEACSSSACVCASGVYCGQTCMPAHDQQNCGACGKSCAASQICGAGVCACAGAGLSPCGNACVDLGYDKANCGACGKACRSGETCNAGSCTCPAGQTYCEGAAKCVPLGSDSSNCGACGKVCNPTETCSTGTCTCPTSGQQYCASQGACTDTLSNAAHCGACDSPCPPTEECSGGSCGCPKQGDTYCSNAKACVSTLTDAKNCGACGKVCPANTHCAGGGCVCDAAGQTLCGSKCFDLTTSTSNCGSCGKSCGAPLICAHSTCTCSSATIGAAVRLTSSTTSSFLPATAWDGTHIGLVYSRLTTNLRNSDGNLRFALLNPDGSVVSDTALTDYPPDDYEGVWPYSKPAIVFNGTEYAVAWVHHLSELTSMAAEVRFQRISTSGVASPSVVVVTSAELPESTTGPGLLWYPASSTYAVAYSRIDLNKTYIRVIGAQGTSIGKTIDTPGAADSPALATDPAGRWCLAWNPSGNGLLQQVFDATLTTPDPQTYFGQFATWGYGNVHWDGASFLSYGTGSYDELKWFRSGAAAPTQILQLPEGTGPSQLVGVDLNGGEALLWTDASGKQKFQRFTLPASIKAAPTQLDDAVTVPSFGAPYMRYSLVKAGANKLLFTYSALADPSHRELYANVIDVPSCP